MSEKAPLYSTNLSWLSFNHRVLQEAADPKMPVLERLRFLSIFSSNLDEFFRVKVAALRSLKEDGPINKLDFDPDKLLSDILDTVQKHQNEFGIIYREKIIPELNKNGIFILSKEEIEKKHKEFAAEYFKEKIHPILKVAKLFYYGKAPFLENRRIYLFFPSKKTPSRSSLIVEVPFSGADRFIVFPTENGETHVGFIDDIIRIGLPLFEKDIDAKAYSIKLNRDAELNIEDEFSGNLVKKIQRSLKNRRNGIPSRFLYDGSMPANLVKLLKSAWNFDNEDMVSGGRYHNFNDFFDFPDIVQRKDLLYPQLPKIPIKELDDSSNYFKVLNKKDVLLHYPYHSFNYFLNFLNAACESNSVTDIKITLYRVAKNSEVCKALIRALRRGKKVTAFFEVKARFDEESNLFWAEELRKEGAKVLYSFPGLKVHAKLCLVTRKKGNETKRYAYLSTGNFNEKTANVYTDFGLLTSEKRLTQEVSRVFEILEDMRKRFDFSHLLIAPDKLRNEIYLMIENEIINHLQGKEAEIIIKVNGLDDLDMITRLYRASQLGVKVRLIIRGICRLIPNVKGYSENIEITSIVDRFLEHHRLYWFKNAGDDKLYLSSADFMNRNLSRRIEIAYPIESPELKERLKTIATYYLNDNTKARIIDQHHKNKMVKNKKAKLNAQTAIWQYYADNLQASIADSEQTFLKNKD
ncbi:MAG TPA: polyphosphate kinase 1 [Bacteroidia bacterium]